MYGKQTEYAIAIMSCLAEMHDGSGRRISALELADQRGLPRPFISKTVTALIQAGLVEGTRGPGGGCRLTRDPSEISLYDVYTIFERVDEDRNCPFGGGECGVGPPCAVHHKLVQIQDSLNDLLHNTNFDVFRLHFNEIKDSSTKDDDREPPKKRESYRASRD